VRFALGNRCWLQTLCRPAYITAMHATVVVTTCITYTIRRLNMTACTRSAGWNCGLLYWAASTLGCIRQFALQRLTHATLDRATRPSYVPPLPKRRRLAARFHQHVHEPFAAPLYHATMSPVSGFRQRPQTQACQQSTLTVCQKRNMNTWIDLWNPSLL